MIQFLETLETTPLGKAMRGELDGWEYLFPLVECVHVLALAIVFGTIVMVDLRLLGLVERQSRVSKIAAEMLPYTWVAFGCAAVTGLLMFMSKSSTYLGNLDFRLKFLCMFLAGVNMLAFHFGVYRKIKVWDMQLPTPPAARFAGAASVFLWVGVIFFGRWIGFT
jgi:hypothetical protein